MFCQNGWRYLVESETAGSRLVVHLVQPGDSGNYTCKVWVVACQPGDIGNYICKVGVVACQPGDSGNYICKVGVVACQTRDSGNYTCKVGISQPRNGRELHLLRRGEAEASQLQSDLKSRTYFSFKRTHF